MLWKYTKPYYNSVTRIKNFNHINTQINAKYKLTQHKPAEIAVYTFQELDVGCKPDSLVPFC